MLRLALLFMQVLGTCAAPSGDPTPSPDDVVVIRAAVQAGKLVDVDLLDHLIIGSAGKWVSLKERGLGFS